jgi:phage pi2 protein 07
MVSFKEARRQETANIHGNKYENVISSVLRKLWNTTDIKEPKLEWNSDNHKDTVISPDALEKTLKLMQNGKSPG